MGRVAHQVAFDQDLGNVARAVGRHSARAQQRLREGDQIVARRNVGSGLMLAHSAEDAVRLTVWPIVFNHKIGQARKSQQFREGPVRRFRHRIRLCDRCCLVAAPAFAAWPERPITVIVPWGAGGAADQLARISARCWSRTSRSRSTSCNGPAAAARSVIRRSRRRSPTATPRSRHGRDHHDALAEPRADTYKDFTFAAIVNTDAAG